MQLRPSGLFQRELADTAIGVVLCVATLAVFRIAAVLANNDRRAEALAQRAGDDVPNAQPSDDTPREIGTKEECERQIAADGALKASGHSQAVEGLPSDDANSPPPPEPAENIPSWLACVVSGNLCSSEEEEAARQQTH